MIRLKNPNVVTKTEQRKYMYVYLLCGAGQVLRRAEATVGVVYVRVIQAGVLGRHLACASCCVVGFWSSF